MEELMRQYDGTRVCRCGKRMVLVGAGIVLCSCPAQHPTFFKCFECLEEEEGPIWTERSRDQLDEERWEKMNRKLGVIG